MARVEIAAQGWGTVQDRRGDAKPGLPVTFSGVVYAAASGAGVITAPVTQTDGSIPGWADPGTYTVTIAGVTRTVEAVSGSSGGGGATLVVQDEGSVLTSRSALNFVGTGVTVTDDAANSRTTITVSGTAGGGIVAINPTALSPAVYFKADTLALSDGAAVSSWADSSGNNRTASQATAGYRPVYRANQVNGRPAVEFDDVDDHLTTANVSTPAGGLTILCVGTRPWNAWRYAAAVTSGWASATGWGMMVGLLGLEDWAYEDMIVVGNGFGSGRVPRVVTETGLIVDGSYHVFGGRLNSVVSPVTTGIVDGAHRSTRFASGGNTAAISAPVMLGAAAVGDGSSWDGLLAEIIVWFTALSDANLQGAVQFLLDKYAITREPA